MYCSLHSIVEVDVVEIAKDKDLARRIREKLDKPKPKTEPEPTAKPQRGSHNDQPPDCVYHPPGIR